MVAIILPVVIGLSVGIGFVLLMMNKPTLPANSICYAKPLDHIVILSHIAVMTPTVLPEGYSFQGGEIVMRSGALSLKYYTESTCGERPKSVNDGIVLVSGFDLDRYVRDNITGAEYMENAFQYWVKWREQGVTVERYTFADGRSAVGMTEFADRSISKVLIADDNRNTWYEVQAKLPLQEAVSIAESLREVIRLEQ